MAYDAQGREQRRRRNAAEPLREPRPLAQGFAIRSVIVVLELQDPCFVAVST